MLTLDKIYHAKFVLKQVARKTDLIAATRLCPGTDLYLKTENLQVTGSFKVRGAYYKISQLSAEERAKGVIACSAGNHAQGVALAATRMGIKSVVCMPDGAPIMKVESTKRLGAEVELVKGTYDDAHDRAVELQEQTGMTFIHPYDDELVIAGQGTIGLEILDQLPDVDAVIVPIGGGGLISGVAFAIKSLRPEVKIYGVQAAGAPSMEHAFHDHKYETLDSAVTFADGIAVKTPGETTFDMVSQYVDEIVTVSEDEIAAAILALMENQKLVAEGAGATPVAAALFGKLPLAGKKTVCLISGGNIDVNILSRVITRGLVMSGRKTNLMIALIAVTIGLLFIGSIFFLSSFFIKSILVPVSQINATAKRIAAGSYGVQIPGQYDDEIGELVSTINDMSVKIGQAEKTQTEFISSVSHELRTPLTAISGWGETLLTSENLDAETRRGVVIIAREAKRLTGMVEELLEFTRMQDGRFTLHVETADILAEFEDTVFMYGNRLKQEGICLHYDGCDEEIPEIPCDVARMRQVFLNILDNAAKHGGEGKRIDASIAHEGSFVVIRMRDYGPGIPEEELPHVKLKFYKGSSKARGSGIGLAVCEEIVTMHGGTLTLENAEGGGTLVTISIPTGEE